MKVGSFVTVSPNNSLLIDLAHKEGKVIQYDEETGWVQAEFKECHQLIWLQPNEIESVRTP
jgi:hypothetical protein